MAAKNLAELEDNMARKFGNGTPASDAEIKRGLRLIKRHITFEKNAQNEDLHKAISILVDEFRRLGRLK